MLKISEKEVLRRFHIDNPWWQDPGNIRWKHAPKRICFTPFYKLVTIRVNRAVVLTGPRGVGKTVMIHQAVARLINKKIMPKRILYVPLGNPLYSVCSLEELLLLFVELNELEQNESVFVFFDEIQYMRNWEIHLKCLVDSYPHHRFVVAGSGTPALKLKSRESGAGRFTDLFLPPLTFYEYVKLSGSEEKLFARNEDGAPDLPETLERIEVINEKFVDYLNLGNCPGTALPEESGKDRSGCGGNDFIDNVLLRDLPSLYGVSDIPELNQLLTLLVLNTGREIDPRGLFRGSKAAMGTISRYLEYLEATFLVRRVSRVDKHAKNFKRERKFKIYPANPSIYASLFGPVEKETGDTLEKLAEAIILERFFRLADNNEKPRYARWKNGKTDVVLMDRIGTKPECAMEIRWSDEPVEDPSEVKGLLDFAAEHGLADPGSLICYTLSKADIQKRNGRTVLFYPISLACFELGRCADVEEFRKTLVASMTREGNRKVLQPQGLPQGGCE